jgi:lipopolysaccharide transport system ATP-binding protein
MIALRARQLGKAFHLHARPLDSLKEVFLGKVCQDLFWALQDIELDVLVGTVLGIVGSNGSGKTTLLQLLAGTLSPTIGSVERQGRISAILELGSGFHPDLTGQENIALGCAALGLSPTETNERIPQIIAFSELQECIDRPVKTYSTGMYARLAFSVAISVDPDILVVDEVLSVGDQHFQKKSLNHMMSIRNQGKTMVFCSHDLYQIREICDCCLWLRDGKRELYGPTLEVTEAYQDFVRSLDTPSPPSEAALPGKTPTDPQKVNFIREVTLGGDCHEGVLVVGGSFTVRVIAHLEPAVFQEGVEIGILLVRNDNVWCYGVSTAIDSVKVFPVGENERGIQFVLEDLPLLAGLYELQVFLFDHLALHVFDQFHSSPLRVSHGTREVGMVRLKHHWLEP